MENAKLAFNERHGLIEVTHANKHAVVCVVL